MTSIEWTDATWNPVVGCSLVSPGCTNCYAMRMARRLDKPGSHYEGTTQVVNGKPVWTGTVNRAPEHILTAPLRWRKPKRIFVNSMSDLFHEDVPEEWIGMIFAVMALAPQHKFQVLTKRPERMWSVMRACSQVSYVTNIPDLATRIAVAMESLGSDVTPVKVRHLFPLSNVHLGTSIEDKRRLDERLRYIRETPAAVRFLSLEPLLGPLGNLDLTNIGWVIVGGESGPGARPMHPDWARSIRDQCVAAGVPFFFKQWGEWLGVNSGHPGLYGPGFGVFDHCQYDQKHECVRVGKKAAGRLLDGRTWDEYPK